MLYLIQIIDGLFSVVWWLVLARVILSWLPLNPRNSAIRFIHDMTEPLLKPFRNLLPSGGIGLDFSPIFLLIVMQLVQRALHHVLLGLG